MTDICLSSVQVSLNVSGKALKASNPDPSARPRSAVGVPNGEEKVLVFLVQFFRFCVEAFLECI